MSDLFRGYDLTRVADEVARKTYERDAASMADKVPWDDLEPMHKHTVKSALLPIISDVIDALEASRPVSSKAMVEYGYANLTTGGERMDPRWYENQPDQSDPKTATTWVAHLHIAPDHKAIALERAAQLTHTTGEYLDGDSWEEWGRPSTGPDDNHIAIYFTAEPNRAQFVGEEIVTSIALAVGSVANEDTMLDIAGTYAISTAGDFAEQLKES